MDKLIQEILGSKSIDEMDVNAKKFNEKILELGPQRMKLVRDRDLLPIYKNIVIDDLMIEMVGQYIKKLELTDLEYDIVFDFAGIRALSLPMDKRSGWLLEKDHTKCKFNKLLSDEGSYVVETEVTFCDIFFDRLGLYPTEIADIKEGELRDWDKMKELFGDGNIMIINSLYDMKDDKFIYKYVSRTVLQTLKNTNVSIFDSKAINDKNFIVSEVLTKDKDDGELYKVIGDKNKGGVVLQKFWNKYRYMGSVDNFKILCDTLDARMTGKKNPEIRNAEAINKLIDSASWGAHNSKSEKDPFEDVIEFLGSMSLYGLLTGIMEDKMLEVEERVHNIKSKIIDDGSDNPIKVVLDAIRKSEHINFNDSFNMLTMLEIVKFENNGSKMTLAEILTSDNEIMSCVAALVARSLYLKE